MKQEQIWEMEESQPSMVTAEHRLARHAQPQTETGNHPSAPGPYKTRGKIHQAVAREGLKPQEASLSLTKTPTKPHRRPPDPTGNTQP